MVSQVDALLTHLGTGRWSVLHIIVMGYSTVFLTPHALGGAFFAPRLDYSCRLPGSSISEASNFSIFSLQANSTSTSASFISEAKCEYKIDTPDGERIEECVEFDFDNSTFSSTFTSEYHLACGRAYLQPSFQSMYMFGVFVGAPINGYLSDKYGRKCMVTLGYIGYVMLGLVSAWLPLLSTILVARFLLGCLYPPSFCTSYINVMEAVEPKIRTLVGFGITITWACVTMLCGGLSYWIRDWRVLQTIATLPGLLILPALCVTDESPRWLIVNGRPQEALRVLGKVARWHGVDLPPEAEMKNLVEEQAANVHDRLQHSSVRCLLKSIISEALVLLRTPLLRTITLCLYLDYLMLGMVYYGISLGGTSIGDDPFLYMVLSGLTELPAYTITGFIVQHFGSKCTLCVFFLITAVVLFALAVTPAVYSTTLVVLAMVGKMTVTAGFLNAFFFSNELFPTEVRAKGMATSYMISRIGAMVSPFITDLVGSIYPWVPFFIFGSGALLAGAVTLLLPETRGQVLPDTMAHLEARAAEKPRRQIKIPRILASRV